MLQKVAADNFLRGVTKRQLSSIRKPKSNRRPGPPMRPATFRQKARGKPKTKRPVRGPAISRSSIAPIAISNTVRNRPAHPVRIAHRELVATITSTTTDFTLAYRSPVQPGINTAFPWLFALAHSFDQYSVGHCTYEFITRCNTSTPGAVIMAFDYDATDSPFTTYPQMANHDSSISCSPWKDAKCPIDRRATQDYRRHYIRSNTPNATTDLKTTDVATFTLALNGVPSGVVGDLYVDYSFTFYKPQQPTSLMLSEDTWGHLTIEPTAGPHTSGRLYDNDNALFHFSGSFLHDGWDRPDTGVSNQIMRLYAGRTYTISICADLVLGSVTFDLGFSLS